MSQNFFTADEANGEDGYAEIFMGRDPVDLDDDDVDDPDQTQQDQITMNLLGSR